MLAGAEWIRGLRERGIASSEAVRCAEEALVFIFQRNPGFHTGKFLDACKPVACTCGSPTCEHSDSKGRRRGDPMYGKP